MVANHPIYTKGNEVGGVSLVADHSTNFPFWKEKELLQDNMWINETYLSVKRGLEFSGI